MPIPHVELIASPAIAAAATYLVLHFVWGRRLHELERDLQTCTDAICQIADTHMTSQRRMAGAITELEKKIVELTAPERRTGTDLDKRHRVLRLARNGVALDDISKRLKLPRGEAELILRLRKYVEMGPVQNQTSRGDVKSHAQS
jgi:hypothetical protein